jgi:hypothetical protein
VDVNPRFVFCDDLEAPLLAVVMDLVWWRKHSTEIIEWMRLRGYGTAGAGHIILFDDQESKTEFVLRWS